MGVPVTTVLFVMASLGQALILIEGNGAVDEGAPDGKKLRPHNTFLLAQTRSLLGINGAAAARKDVFAMSECALFAPSHCSALVMQYNCSAAFCRDVPPSLYLSPSLCISL